MPKAADPSNLKTFAVTFMFPELKGGAIYQSATATGSDLGIAISRAWRMVRKLPAIKGKRITQAKITIVESVEAKESKAHR